MDILLSNSSPKPIYEQIAAQVKAQIISGALRQGDPLPSMCQLARDLCISVITTKRAYEELEQAGFIETVAGKGCFVAGADPGAFREEHLARVLEYLAAAVDAARTGSISYQETARLLEELYKEES